MLLVTLLQLANFHGPQAPASLSYNNRYKSVYEPQW